ncbi:MAG: amidohydrolase [Chitinophagales bacterium]|nr:amidohydrolase [Chitinophagales bacterium]
MNKYAHFLILVLFLFSCQKKKVDLIIHHAVIYSVDSLFKTYEAAAIKDGVFFDLGNSAEILEKYDADSVIDAKNQYIYPGFIDAHSHFYWYGHGLQTVDLTGTKSMEEVIERVKLFIEAHPEKKWIIGRGWDQNDWAVKEFPTNEALNEHFQNHCIVLKRVDGHALLANHLAISEANADRPEIAGGRIIRKNGQNTGIYIDNAMDLFQQALPKEDASAMSHSLLEAQNKCFAVGLTSVCDAGLDRDVLDIIDSLNKLKLLQMRIYAMISLSEKNLNHYLNKGYYKTNHLNIRSFKVYADGALGSRGACLLHAYHDKPKEKGFLLKTAEELDSIIGIIAAKNFQINTHCIGDSANRSLLKIYAKHLKGKNNMRWRIEHAQVVDSNDFFYFKDYSIIPSVQPTHATSDMYWAEERLGKERLRYAYAYKRLLKTNDFIPLGSDFPVEDINPLYGFYAATARQDVKGYPTGGFQLEDALTREEALRGMTIWAAYAQFEEHEKGSIEKNKLADFVMMNIDLMKAPLIDIRHAKILSTYSGGKRVY